MNKINLLSKRIDNKCPPLVEDAISLIEDNYAFLYGIDDLACQLEVSKPHLIRSFTAVCGISPGKYLTYIRLKKAKSILSSPNVPPLEIVAVACGYSSSNYFSKAFKKFTGVTPMAYAKSSHHHGESLSEAEYTINKMYL